jgi:hypothetical protein
VDGTPTDAGDHVPGGEAADEAGKRLDPRCCSRRGYEPGGEYSEDERDHESGKYGSPVDVHVNR